MGKVVVKSFGVSLDGFAAWPDQSLEHPLGVRGPEIMEWVFPTRFFQRMHGDPQGEGGETGIDNEMAERSFAGVGAWILGRNMFGPVRGPWPDDSWEGWWGDEPLFAGLDPSALGCECEKRVTGERATHMNVYLAGLVMLAPILTVAAVAIALSP